MWEILKFLLSLDFLLAITVRRFASVRGFIILYGVTGSSDGIQSTSERFESVYMTKTCNMIRSLKLLKVLISLDSW